MSEIDWAEVRYPQPALDAVVDRWREKVAGLERELEVAKTQLARMHATRVCTGCTILLDACAAGWKDQKKCCPDCSHANVFLDWGSPDS